MALGRDAVLVGDGGPPPSSHNSISLTAESAILMRQALFSNTTKRDSCDPYVWSPGMDRRRARGLLIIGLSCPSFDSGLSFLIFSPSGYIGMALTVSVDVVWTKLTDLAGRGVKNSCRDEGQTFEAFPVPITYFHKFE